MFENRVLRRIFGPKRDKVTGEWRKLHNEELSDLYSSPNIVRVKKIEKIEMGGACSAYGERRDVYRVLVENLNERDHLGDPGVDGRIILTLRRRIKSHLLFAGIIRSSPFSLR